MLLYLLVSLKWWERPMLFVNFSVDSLTLIAILLFIGAMGKSAQIGLHTWLPNAMEGPTPVSALIQCSGQWLQPGFSC